MKIHVTIWLMSLLDIRCQQYDLNDYRSSFAIQHSITNMKELEFSSDLQAIANNLTCENLRENNDKYRIMFFADPSTDSNFSKITEDTEKMLASEELQRVVDAVNEYRRPTPNPLELYVPSQTQLACVSNVNCADRINDIDVRFNGFCLLGPRGGGNLRYSEFEIKGEPMSKATTTNGLMKSLRRYRWRKAVDFSITNMRELYWSKHYSLEATRMGQTCEHPRFNSAHRFYFPETSYKSPSARLLRDGELEDAIENVMAQKEPLPNMVDLIHPKQTRIGCGKYECERVIDGKKVQLAMLCLIGPHGTLSLSDFVINGRAMQTKAPFTEPTEYPPTTPGVFRNWIDKFDIPEPEESTDEPADSGTTPFHDDDEGKLDLTDEDINWKKAENGSSYCSLVSLIIFVVLSGVSC